MFELTGTLNYIVPCMVTLASAKLVSDQFEALGIVEVLIRRKGFPYLDPRQEETVFGTAGENMIRIEDLECFMATGMTLQGIQNVLKSTQFQGFPIITSASNPNLVGYITRSDLLKGMSTFFSYRKSEKTDGLP
jgi:chloride channel 3/4/5